MVNEIDYFDDHMITINNVKVGEWPHRFRSAMHCSQANIAESLCRFQSNGFSHALHYDSCINNINRVMNDVIHEILVITIKSMWQMLKRFICKQPNNRSPFKCSSYSLAVAFVSDYSLCNSLFHDFIQCVGKFIVNAAYCKCSLSLLVVLS